MEQDSKVSFINGYWPALADQGWMGLILHDWKRIPDHIDSDIDYVVSGPTPRELILFLDAYCRKAGWRLVQILEHEIDSLCCICFQQASPFESVSLDVTWDYRRKGIDLISNEVLIEGAWRPADKAFHVPAPKVEFLYRLVKVAAKDKSLRGQEELVNALNETFESDPMGVNELLKNHTGVVMTARESREGFMGEIEEILKTAYFAKIRNGRSCGAREIARRIRRVIQPTGLLVKCEAEVGPSVRDEVFLILREAFRIFEREETSGSFVSDWISKRKSVLMLRGEGSSGNADLTVKSNSADGIAEEILGFLQRRLWKRWNLSELNCTSQR